nr:MAG TPA: protein of unknown function (DUF1992) [Caudoviricetes sp.]
MMARRIIAAAQQRGSFQGLKESGRAQGNKLRSSQYPRTAESETRLSL